MATFIAAVLGVLVGSAAGIFHMSLKYAHMREQYQQMKRYLVLYDEDICQTLGRALGYPGYDDDDELIDVQSKSARDLAREAAIRIAAVEANLYDPR